MSTIDGRTRDNRSEDFGSIQTLPTANDLVAVERHLDPGGVAVGRGGLEGKRGCAAFDLNEGGLAVKVDGLVAGRDDEAVARGGEVEAGEPQTVDSAWQQEISSIQKD